jgi:outer membrane protein
MPGLPACAILLLSTTAAWEGGATVQRGSNDPAAVASSEAMVSPAQLFAIGDTARDRGDVAMAERAYRALAENPGPQIRTEGRFRLGMMYAAMRRYRDAALLFRRILDEQPQAHRVRLELAQMLERIGDEQGARRTLREAQAGGLPPEVARLVDRYSDALRARKPVGASLDVSLAPDSNINRATRSDTLGTVIGEFELGRDAQARSGIGLATRGQAYARLPLSNAANLLMRAQGSLDLYRESEFNDLLLAASVGPELQFGRGRLAVEVGTSWRWVGGTSLSKSTIVSVNYLRPLGPRAQLRGTVAVAAIDHNLNPLQNGHSFAASVTYEKALSSRSGIGLTASAERQSLADPGYSLWSGRLTGFGYREVGRTTLVGTLGIGRLVADERLFLFPGRREETSYRASAGATLRHFTIAGFAPLLRISMERNRSSIEIFDHRRWRAEAGITRAF